MKIKCKNNFYTKVGIADNKRLNWYGGCRVAMVVELLLAVKVSTLYLFFKHNLFNKIVTQINYEVLKITKPVRRILPAQHYK